jgi:hypothetical protein
MRILFFLLLLIQSLQLAAEETAISNLKDFQWKNRILLLANPPKPPETLESLLKLGPQFAERQLLWFLFSGDKIETNYAGKITGDFGKNIRDEYFKGNSEQVVLIGKDGREKYRTVTFSPVEIFQRIDRMPMRKQEMQGSHQPSEVLLSKCTISVGSLNFAPRLTRRFCQE